MTDRSHEIMSAWLAGSRQSDPLTAFQRLAERVPGLTTADIVAAADQAKAMGSELRSLAHRIERAAEHERRRNR